MADIVDSIVGKIRKSLVTRIGRQFGYIFFYSRNIENLRDQVEKLESMRQRLVDDAAKKNIEIIKDVEEWLKNVDGIVNEANRVFEDQTKVQKRFLNCWCPNMKLRYLLSRKAKRNSQVVVDLQHNCSKYAGLSHQLHQPEIANSSTRSYEGFKLSRISIVKEVIEVLKDDEVKMIGICGIGGVGKTTLVKEVGKTAKEKKLFDEVVMVVVSQQPQPKNIQRDIAESLGLKLVEGSLLERANQLHTRLENERILTIFDDVWEKLNLEEVGISFGGSHKGCKIILTSRREDLCKEMGTQKNIPVGVLSEEEAWKLFTETAGNSIDNPDLQLVAKGIVNECGGLPISLVTLGKALGHKDKLVWDDALLQLKNSIPRLQSKVHQCLQLSYNHLENEEARSVFLLCCLFREDYDIPVEYLVRYGMGLQLFKGISTLEDARNKVHFLVDTLRSCHLLLGSNKEERVKLHDVVRDFGLSVTSEGDPMLMVRHDAKPKEWQKEKTHHQYTSISLISDVESSISLEALPSSSQKLELLRLECKDAGILTPYNFFEGTRSLKVIDMWRMPLNSPPSTLQFLTNLQTLCMEDCPSLGDISIIGTLVNLKILSFSGCKFDCQGLFPKEIGKLTGLRLLDLTGCHNLTTISPDVISSLSGIEELYMGYGFLGWEVEEEGKERCNATLRELESLNDLTTLNICIPDLNLLQRNINLGKKLTKYDILIGRDPERKFPFHDKFLEKPWRYKTTMYLTLPELSMSSHLGSGFSELLKNTESLRLEGMELNNAINELVQEGFQFLKELRIGDCPNFKKICESQLPLGSFRQLKYLNIYQCMMMEEVVFVKTPQDGKLVEFPQLDELSLYLLPKLKSFCIEESNNTGLSSLFHKEVKLISLKKLILNSLDSLTKIWSDPIQVDSFCKLRVVNVHKCNNLLNVVPFNLIQRLNYLEEFKVSLCKSLQVLVDFEWPSMEEQSKIRVVDFKGLFVKEESEILPRLKSVWLSTLPKLTHVWRENPSRIQGFQDLNSVTIYSCDSLRNIFPHSIAKLLVKLEELDISGCDLLEEIVTNDRGEEENEGGIEIIQLPRVKSIRLRVLHNLSSFYSEPNSHISSQHHLFNNQVKLTKLEKLNLRCLDRLTKIWSDKIQVDSFRETSVVKVWNCNNLLKAVPSNVIQILQNLETLEVQLCRSMEVVVDFEDPNMKEQPAADVILILPRLKRVLLRELPTLTHVWKKNPKGIQGFQDLKVVVIEHCNKLTNIFPSSIAKLLVKLEQLDISSCDLLEQIVTNDCGDEGNARAILELPVVKSLILRCLPKLTSFYSEPSAGYSNIPMQQHIFNQQVKLNSLKKLILSCLDSLDNKIWSDQIPVGSFYELSELTVYNCNNMLNVVPSKLIQRLERLEKLQVYHCTSLQVVVDFEGLNLEEQEQPPTHVILPCLKRVDLKYLPKLTSVWGGNPRGIQGLQDLNSVAIKYCDSLENIFSASIAKLLVKLEKLEIDCCQKLEEIVANDDGVGEENKMAIETIELPIIENLILRNLPKLTGFYSKPYSSPTPSSLGDSDKPMQPHLFNKQISFPSLEELELDNLGNLEVMVLDQLPAESLRKLRKMTLQSLPKLMNIFTNYQQQGTFFENLTYLKVDSCGSLRNLFSATIATGLVYLQTLVVLNCSMMEEIIAKEEEEQIKRRMDSILFPQLHYLELGKLPELTNFWQTKYDLMLPLLEIVHVNDCPKMKTLSLGLLSTPKLTNVFTGQREGTQKLIPGGEQVGMSDLNNTIRRPFTTGKEPEVDHETLQQEQIDAINKEA